ncbi:thiol reductant ABC exporter subunit CydC [Evansella cellulosilytica]|uniref:ABC transporter, CydDC cysteine exporter (CydDC-E) family, permease/ATP-binding protein CydC n=1 Tax=Evansella cellulosilytica (strain ATCC 21833 / DSM 2522 / FERM P-1141 / JCM 9156 / N-4) TaxID=649639 RepID=E6TU79_EVAC2|nr:thiol reductant ABC exporter subunit CydC [Evansella cellulosilytica]ADU28539.1 ABC transporter, CydDC cysteine exporter (CydDC-E) family, permease/ATP-binding protein CydC [Evansella cellulosilytica DSM 2522]
MKELNIVIKLMLVEKKDVLYSILFGFLAGIAAVSLFANSGYLISKAAINPPLYILTVSIALLKFFSFTRALSKYAERYYSHRATFTILSNLRVKFFEKLEPLAPKVFHKYRSGDLLARIVGDVESLQNFFLRVYYPPIIMVIVFLATIAFTTFFSVEVAVALVVGLFITGFIIPMIFAVRQRAIENQLRSVRGSVSTEATEFLYGFRDLKLYQRLEQQEKNLIDASNTYVDEQSKESVHALYAQSLNQTITLLVSWVILAMGAYLVSAGTLDGVFLAMLVMISLTVFENATPMAAFPSHFEDSRRAAGRLFTIVGEEDIDQNETVPKEKMSTNVAPAIKLNDVTFIYPEETRPALKHLNLTIPAGSKTAIVGPSGSGKSTFMQVLLKMYTSYDGTFDVNGVSLSKLDESSIWETSNVVLQHNHFFYGTIRDNLLLVSEDLSDAEMESALRKVQLDTFSLYDQVLEKGENLSGGEKQRLAIARAMLKQSRLWLLDEPTSSIDVLTEAAIYHNLFEESKEDTLVLISHRLTGLEMMDQIIVMEQGTVIEAGSFDELMEKQGYFYEMKQIEKSVFTA